MKNNKSQSNIKKYSILFILIFTFVFLSVPLLRFFSNQHLAGSEPYYHLRISELLHNKITNYDDLGFSGRPYYLNLNHLVLSRFNNILFFVMFLPMLFGLLSVFIFYKIIDSYGIEKKHNMLICLILASSPVFIFTFTIYNLYFLPIFLLLLSLFFLLRDNLVVPAICLALLPLFNIVLVPFALLLLFIYYTKYKKKGFTLLIASLSFTSILYYFIIYYPLTLPQMLNLQTQPFLSYFVSDFGSDFGFSAFMLLLGIIGFYKSWRNKRDYLYIYIITFSLLAASYFFTKANIFLNFFIVLFSALAVVSMLNMNWKLELVKKATILLVVCGLLFSSVSYFNRLLKMEPSNEQVNSIIYMKGDSANKDIVLSYYKNGFWIEYFAEKPTMLDEYIYYAPNLKNRYNASQAIFYSRSLDSTKKLLDNYNVKYIWIDEKMKSGLVWNKEEQGLLFLLQNKETFKNIYNSSEVEVWKYLK